MRCPDCELFVSYGEEDPEVEDVEVTDAEVEVSVNEQASAFDELV